jgi:hypothetical protein
MPPSNNSGTANAGTVIPAAWQTAINDLRRERYLQSDRDDPPSVSEVIREATEFYLAVLKTHGALPDSAMDDVEGIDAPSVLKEYAVKPDGVPDVEIDVIDETQTDGGSVEA